ncbi:hypothetical protein CLOM_g15145 [Closterium sp. NIES-68]|nr:hypothetical protein CLOM_g15145 [Closterium sp. NIES-68]
MEWVQVDEGPDSISESPGQSSLVASEESNLRGENIGAESAAISRPDSPISAVYGLRETPLEEPCSEDAVSGPETLDTETRTCPENPEQASLGSEVIPAEEERKGGGKEDGKKEEANDQENLEDKGNQDKFYLAESGAESESDIAWPEMSAESLDSFGMFFSPSKALPDELQEETSALSTASEGRSSDATMAVEGRSTASEDRETGLKAEPVEVVHQENLQEHLQENVQEKPTEVQVVVLTNQEAEGQETLVGPPEEVIAPKQHPQSSTDKQQQQQQQQQEAPEKLQKHLEEKLPEQAQEIKAEASDESLQTTAVVLELGSTHKQQQQQQQTLSEELVKHLEEKPPEQARQAAEASLDESPQTTTVVLELGSTQQQQQQTTQEEEQEQQQQQQGTTPENVAQGAAEKQVQATGEERPLSTLGTPCQTPPVIPEQTTAKQHGQATLVTEHQSAPEKPLSVANKQELPAELLSDLDTPQKPLITAVYNQRNPAEPPLTFDIPQMRPHIVGNLVSKPQNAAERLVPVLEPPQQPHVVGNLVTKHQNAAERISLIPERLRQATTPERFGRSQISHVTQATQAIQITQLTQITHAAQATPQRFGWTPRPKPARSSSPDPSDFSDFRRSSDLNDFRRSVEVTSSVRASGNLAAQSWRNSVPESDGFSFIGGLVRAPSERSFALAPPEPRRMSLPGTYRPEIYRPQETYRPQEAPSPARNDGGWVGRPRGVRGSFDGGGAGGAERRMRSSASGGEVRGRMYGVGAEGRLGFGAGGGEIRGGEIRGGEIRGGFSAEGRGAYYPDTRGGYGAGGGGIDAVPLTTRAGNSVGSGSGEYGSAALIGTAHGPQPVTVAVNIRPLISRELTARCMECVTVPPGGAPQVRVLPDWLFTYDHVYGGGGGRPMSLLFDDCIEPLVYGLFEGYNATVFAYGQTGSGKTYTMGTAVQGGIYGDVDGSGPSAVEKDGGVTRRVVDTLFSRVEQLSGLARFQIRVALIEIHKDDIRDLLELTSLGGGGGHMYPHSAASRAIMSSGPSRQPISIRETAGGISLTGVTEQVVHSREEAIACLEDGLLFRATGGHNLNARSSRSHAIFTIFIDQFRPRAGGVGGGAYGRGGGRGGADEEHLCAKMHLVDLAGSERIKRTHAEGVRMQEGIHINRGLLALGNVISALSTKDKDDRRKREGKGGWPSGPTHVPYRDSKLTRLLQDSLGGNSRTVMIACVSPSDNNVDETINTLKYANRARNICNKPMVNRLGEVDAEEVRRLRQQIGLLQSELARASSAASAAHNDDELQQLQQRVDWLESSNGKLRQGLAEAQQALSAQEQKAADAEGTCVKLRREMAAAITALDQERTEAALLRRRAEEIGAAGGESGRSGMDGAEVERLRERVAEAEAKARREAERAEEVEGRAEAERQRADGAEEEARQAVARAEEAEALAWELKVQAAAVTARAESDSGNLAEAQVGWEKQIGLVREAAAAEGVKRAVLEARLEQLQEECEGLRSRVEEERVRAQGAEAALAGERGRGERDVEVGRLTAEVEVTKLQAEVTIMKEQVAAEAARAAEAVAAAKEAREDLQVFRQDVHVLSQRLSSAEEALKEEEAKSMELEIEVGRLKADLAAAEAVAGVAKTRVDEAEAEVRRARAEGAEARARATDSEGGEGRKSSSGEDEDERVWVEEVRKALTAAHEQDMKEVKREIEALEKRAEEAEREAEQVRTQLEQARNSLIMAREEVEQARRQSEEARGELEEVRAKAEWAEKGREALEREVEEGREKVGEMVKEMEGLLSEVKGGKGREEEAQRRRAEVEEEVERVRERLEEVEAEREALKGVVEEVERQKEEAERRRGEMERREEELGGRVEEAERRVEGVREELRERSRELGQMEVELGEVMERRVAAEQHAAMEAEHAERLGKQLQALLKQLGTATFLALPSEDLLSEFSAKYPDLEHILLLMDEAGMAGMHMGGSSLNSPRSLHMASSGLNSPRSLHGMGLSGAASPSASPFHYTVSHLSSSLTHSPASERWREQRTGRRRGRSGRRGVRGRWMKAGRRERRERREHLQFGQAKAIVPSAHNKEDGMALVAERDGEMQVALLDPQQLQELGQGQGWERCGSFTTVPAHVADDLALVTTRGSSGNQLVGATPTEESPSAPRGGVEGARGAGEEREEISVEEVFGSPDNVAREEQRRKGRRRGRKGRRRGAEEEEQQASEMSAGLSLQKWVHDDAAQGDADDDDDDVSGGRGGGGGGGGAGVGAADDAAGDVLGSSWGRSSPQQSYTVYLDGAAATGEDAATRLADGKEEEEENIRAGGSEDCSSKVPRSSSMRSRPLFYLPPDPDTDKAADHASGEAAAKAVEAAGGDQAMREKAMNAGEKGDRLSSFSRSRSRGGGGRASCMRPFGADSSPPLKPTSRANLPDHALAAALTASGHLTSPALLAAAGGSAAAVAAAAAAAAVAHREEAEENERGDIMQSNSPLMAPRVSCMPISFARSPRGSTGSTGSGGGGGSSSSRSHSFAGAVLGNIARSHGLRTFRRKLRGGSSGGSSAGGSVAGGDVAVVDVAGGGNHMRNHTSHMQGRASPYHGMESGGAMSPYHGGAFPYNGSHGGSPTRGGGMSPWRGSEHGSPMRAVGAQGLHAHGNHGNGYGNGGASPVPVHGSGSPGPELSPESTKRRGLASMFKKSQTMPPRR